MSHIVWRKTYIVEHKLGVFRIYISEHTNGLFYGSVAYFTRQGSWSKGEVIDMELKVQAFFDKTEKTVYDKCVAWINDNLGTEFRILE